MSLSTMEVAVKRGWPAFAKARTCYRSEVSSGMHSTAGLHIDAFSVAKVFPSCTFKGSSVGCPMNKQNYLTLGLGSSSGLQ